MEFTEHVLTDPAVFSIIFDAYAATPRKLSLNDWLEARR
jgi:hypothetical protein